MKLLYFIKNNLKKKSCIHKKCTQEKYFNGCIEFKFFLYNIKLLIPIYFLKRSFERKKIINYATKYFLKKFAHILLLKNTIMAVLKLINASK